jgi:hypothetical protein
MDWIFYILIYIVSFIIHIILQWIENGKKYHTVGDILDNIDFHMWFPILNTFVLIAIVIMFIAYGISKLLKLNYIWNKFRNIKLK